MAILPCVGTSVAVPTLSSPSKPFAHFSCLSTKTRRGFAIASSCSSFLPQHSHSFRWSVGGNFHHSRRGELQRAFNYLVITRRTGTPTLLEQHLYSYPKIIIGAQIFAFICVTVVFTMLLLYPPSDDAQQRQEEDLQLHHNDQASSDN